MTDQMPDRDHDSLRLPGPSIIRNSELHDVWVAVAEYSQPTYGATVSAEAMADLMHYLDDWQPSGLWSADRYAIQLQIPAQSPDQALHWALNYHEQAARAAGFPPVTLLRIEVLTSDEYEKAFEMAEPAGTDIAEKVGRSLFYDELYFATRSLHAASTPAELNDVVTGFVTAFGGRIEPGVARSQSETLEIDVCVGGERQVHATAETFSVAGLMMEQALPTLLADARFALSRLRQTPSRS